MKKAADWLAKKVEWVWDKIKSAAKAVAHFFGL